MLVVGKKCLFLAESYPRFYLTGFTDGITESTDMREDK